jgi:hypothetical protein
VTSSGRSMLRRAPILLVMCCLAVAPGVPAAAQSGPAPDPGRSDSGAPSPDPAPGAPDAPAPDTSKSTAGSSSPQTATQPAPPPQPPPAPVDTTVSPPETSTQVGRKQNQKKVERRDAPPEWTAKEVTRQAVPSIQRIDDSSSAALMLGGLALLALVICDTVFLTLSTRAMRRAG